MNDMNFICPTCKRPTHPDDNEIIEYLIKEKDRYRDILGKRTKELERTRKALEIAVDALDAGRTLARIAGFEMLAAGMDEAIDKITTLKPKDTGGNK